MDKKNREFIMQNLMVAGFMESHNQEMVLEELEETGKKQERNSGRYSGRSLFSLNNICGVRF